MHQDYAAEYREQLSFLRSSAASYDAGEEPEAKRLALGVRILLHDTRQSTSLLTHLGIKERLPLVDTAPADPPLGVIQMDFGLCYCRLTTGTPGRVEFRAPLGTPDDHREHPPACFADWWSRPVLKDTQGNEFGRSDLVLGVANQDGGAHIDAALKPAYAALTRQHSHGFRQADPGEPNAALTFAFEGTTQVSNPDAEPVSNKEPEDAYAALVSILTSGTLRHSGEATPYGTFPDHPLGGAVAWNPAANLTAHEMFTADIACFCDIPVPDLQLHARKYSRFGLAFRKALLLEKGASPVFYVASDPATWRRLATPP